MKLSVVIPVFQERDNLEPLHFALTEVLAGLGQTYEILFVDDGSRDCSINMLQRIAERDPSVKVVELARNFGQTAALEAGLRLAVGEVVVTLDADLQNDPADILRLLDKLAEGYDLVHGWRRNRQDHWLTRRLPSAAANWLIARLTGYPAHDSGCTLKAMRRDVAGRLQLYGDMHRFIPALAHAQGARCAELVVRHHRRQFGHTKYGLGRTTRVLFDLLTLWLLARYPGHPMRIFGRLSLASLGGAALAAAAAIGLQCWAAMPTAAAVLWTTAAVGLLGALQAWGLGAAAEIVMRTFYESRQCRPYTVRRLHNFDAADSNAADSDAAHSGADLSRHPNRLRRAG